MEQTCGNRRRFLGMALAAGAGATAYATEERQEKDAPTRPVYLVIYRPGPKWPAGVRINELPLRDHGRYLLELFRAGALRYAGPFADDSGGAVIFEAADDESARAIVTQDPPVVSGLFSFQLHRWALVPWSEIAAKAKG